MQEPQGHRGTEEAQRFSFGAWIGEHRNYWESKESAQKMPGRASFTTCDFYGLMSGDRTGNDSADEFGCMSHGGGFVRNVGEGIDLGGSKFVELFGCQSVSAGDDNERLVMPLTQCRDTGDDFTAQALGVELAFAGNHEVGPGNFVFDHQVVENVIDATNELTPEEEVCAGPQSSSGSGCGKVNVDIELPLDHAGNVS